MLSTIRSFDFYQCLLILDQITKLWQETVWGNGTFTFCVVIMRKHTIIKEEHSVSAPPCCWKLKPKYLFLWASYVCIFGASSSRLTDKNNKILQKLWLFHLCCPSEVMCHTEWGVFVQKLQLSCHWVIFYFVLFEYRLYCQTSLNNVINNLKKNTNNVLTKRGYP